MGDTTGEASTPGSFPVHGGQSQVEEAISMVCSCDFCGTARDNEKVDKKAVGYVCSSCVQLLLNMPQEKLARAHDLAVKRGCRGKARAVQSFLGVTTDEPINRHNTSKRFNRKRPVRTFRNDRKAGCGFEKQGGIALYKAEPENPVLLRKGHNRIFHKPADSPKPVRA